MLNLVQQLWIEANGDLDLVGGTARTGAGLIEVHGKSAEENKRGVAIGRASGGDQGGRSPPNEALNSHESPTIQSRSI